MSENKTCFLIGPIGARHSIQRSHSDLLLKRIIQPTFKTHFKDFTIERADHISQPGMIDSQIITMLIESDLVIADLTYCNANVFYELGIRHLMQKPVIHLYQRGEPIPLDIQPYRAIEFSYDEKSELTDAKIELRKAVAHVLDPGFRIDNPVTRSAGFRHLLTAIGRERGKIAGMAVKARMTVHEARAQLQSLASKTVTTHMKPGAFKPYLEPLRVADQQFEDLIVAIGSLGPAAVVGGSAHYDREGAAR